jgi:hypothetical protein
MVLKGSLGVPTRAVDQACVFPGEVADGQYKQKVVGVAGSRFKVFVCLSAHRRQQLSHRKWSLTGHTSTLYSPYDR